MWCGSRCGVGSIKSDENHSLFRVTSSNSDSGTSRKGGCNPSLPVKKSIGYLLSLLHPIIEGIILLRLRDCVQTKQAPSFFVNWERQCLSDRDHFCLESNALIFDTF